MRVSDTYAYPVRTVRDARLRIKNMRNVGDFDADLIAGQHLLAHLDDRRRQVFQDFEAGIGIATQSTDRRRDWQPDHSRTRNGDAHAVLHQVGRDFSLDTFRCGAQMTGGNGRRQRQRNGFGAAERRYDFLPGCFEELGPKITLSGQFRASCGRSNGCKPMNTGVYKTMLWEPIFMRLSEHTSVDRHSTGVSGYRKKRDQSAPQHCLNFLPLPQGQGSLRPTLGSSRRMVCVPRLASQKR